MDRIRERGLWIVLGILIGFGAFMAMGAAPSGDLGRYQPVPIGGGEGRVGLFMVDTHTGVTKIVWGGFSGGQLGKPFSAMVLDPKMAK